MLTFVGIGLYDENDITLRGLEACRAADKVYIEYYTGIWHGGEALERMLGRKLVELKRDNLEQNSGRIVDEAKNYKIVLLVPGDPLVATTHATMISDAMGKGIKTEVIHNASIFSAVCETGLHIYKFGKTTTVPFADKTGGVLPQSLYDTLRLNKKSGLHTLLLLDIASEKKMTSKEGIKILLDLEDGMKESLFTENTEIVVFARAGSGNSIIAFGRVRDLKDRDFGNPPMVLIVPGQMHFTEREHLERFDAERIEEI